MATGMSVTLHAVANLATSEARGVGTGPALTKGHTRVRTDGGEECGDLDGKTHESIGAVHRSSITSKKAETLRHENCTLRIASKFRPR